MTYLKLILLAVFLCGLTWAKGHSDADAIAKKSKDEIDKSTAPAEFVQPYQCEMKKDFDVSKAKKTTPDEAIFFGLVEQDPETKGWKIATDPKNGKCQPLVYDLRTKAKGDKPTFLGLLCSDTNDDSDRAPEDDRHGNRLVKDIVEGKDRNRHHEDFGNTFQTAKACGMPEQFKFYAVRFSKAANKFLRIALPCLKQIDKHTRAKACFEKKPGETRDKSMWMTDAIAAAINEGTELPKFRSFPQGEPARPEKSDPSLPKKVEQDEEKG